MYTPPPRQWCRAATTCCPPGYSLLTPPSNTKFCCIQKKHLLMLCCCCSCLLSLSRMFFCCCRLMLRFTTLAKMPPEYNLVVDGNTVERNDRTCESWPVVVYACLYERDKRYRRMVLISQIFSRIRDTRELIKNLLRIHSFQHSASLVVTAYTEKYVEPTFPANNPILHLC